MKPDLTIILPCRNEEKSLDFCLKDIKKVLKKNKIKAEIIVSDSSQDNSPKIAKKHKVLLLKHDLEGYGIAYLKAFKKAKGKYIFMADSDGTYDFNEIPRFLKELKEGCDLVIGNRFKGKIEKGAMPFLHRYIGNPALSGALRMFFKTKIKDPHSGIRAIKKEGLEKLNLQTQGMEFASEMIIKAIKNGFKIKEVPTNYYARKGNSKLRSFSDGWRHLRFMLICSPMFLFFIPGITLFTAGAAVMLWLYFASPALFGIRFFIHPMFLSSALIIIGYQLIIFTLFAKTYTTFHLEEESLGFKKLFCYLTLERAVILGALMLVIGLVFFSSIFIKWIGSNFGSFDEIKDSVLGLTLIILGSQTIFSSFMLSILGIKR